MNRAKTLTIKWQRLLDEGQTCPRCQSTGEGVETAAAVLRQSLSPLGVDVRLVKEELSVEEFGRDPLQSNVILLNGRLLEDWLGATTGQSECCDACGPNDCRTVGIGETVHEAIPADLVVKAGLLAAAQLLEQGTGDCCPPAIRPGGGCCPR